MFLNLWRRNITSLQSVDVLRVHPEELALLVEQAHKVMAQVGLIVSRIQLLGQSEERIWVVVEEFNFKYGLSVGEVVLLQVVVKSAAWRSEGERTGWRLHQPPFPNVAWSLFTWNRGCHWACWSRLQPSPPPSYSGALWLSWQCPPGCAAPQLHLHHWRKDLETHASLFDCEKVTNGQM